MEKSSLVKTIKTFSLKEFKDFGDYVNSPFFNKNESIIKLYNYLRKLYPDFEASKVQKEYVHKIIFGSAEYNDDFMRMLIFNMTKLAEDYIVYMDMTGSEWEMKKMRIHSLNERKLDKPLKKSIGKTLNELDKKKERSTDWYYYKYFIQNESIYYLFRKYSNRFDKFVNEAPLDNLHKEFTAYYLITILKMHCFILTSKKIYNIEKDIASFEKVIETLDDEFIKETPLINIYYNLTLLLHSDKEEYFENVKKMILRYREYVTQSDMLNVLINLQNYCSRRIRRGELKFGKDKLDLYKIEVEKGYYKVFGYLDDTLYKSIVRLGFETGEREWVKKFIPEYKKDLAPEIKENASNYVMAFSKFFEKDYGKSLEYLAKIKLYDVYSKMEVKELTAKIYFEMNLEDMLFSLADTFRQLLTNSKLLTGNRKTGYANFIRYIKRLYKVSLAPDAGDIAEIKHMIRNEDLLESRLWFDKKIEELEKKARR